MPNGRTLDYVADAPYLGPDGDAPIGVMKQTFVVGLYAAGAATGLYAPPLCRSGRRPHHVVRPDQRGRALRRPARDDIVDEVTSHHSSYYIDHSIRAGAPPDLQRLDGRHLPARRGDPLLQPHPLRLPGADISLFFLDYGHQRGQNKDADIALLEARQDAFLAHHLAGAEKPQGRRHDADPDVRRGWPLAGPFTPRLGGDRPGRGPGTLQARADDRCRGVPTTRRAARRTTRSRAAAPARPPPAPTRPGRPPTGSTRRRRAATR